MNEINLVGITRARFWQNYNPWQHKQGPKLSQQLSADDQSTIVGQIREWSKELGFSQVGIADIELAEHEGYLQKWLDAGYHGTMEYMARHGTKRSRPEELVPGTCRVISVRMDYLADGTQPMAVL